MKNRINLLFRASEENMSLRLFGGRINYYINEGTMNFVKAKKYWIDAGTFDSLHKANLLVRKYK